MKIIPASISAGDPLRPLDVLAEDRGAEAEVGVVGGVDRGRLVGHPHDRGDRAEGLLAEDPHLRLDPGQHQRVDEGAGAVVLEAADQRLGARGDRVLDLLAQGVDEVGTGERADLGRRVGRVADHQRADRLGQLRLELVGDRLGDDEALRRDAGLARVDVARPGCLP